ncbi:MAG: prephenate dehydratase [Chloroflexi bacterium]|nr:prephenate dehydratase [Chloroflexota bacterium]
MARKLAYLGPPGTFSEEAALKYDDKAELVPFYSVPAVAAAVETGLAEQGVVAIENSLEGSVTDTLDLLIHESKLLIRRELVLPIEHHLLVKPGTTALQIEAVFSHPQALAQCRRFLERCFPKAQVVAALSTTAAVEQMMSSPTPAAAIGNQRAAEIYGSEILARNIQDRSPNLTRFVVLARQDHPPTGRDKTSLCFSFDEDRPGLLHDVLKEFADCHINLAKVESRPSKESLGKYVFLVDLEGHRKDPVISRVLSRVKAKTSLFKVFGSYPRYEEGAEAVFLPTNEATSPGSGQTPKKKTGRRHKPGGA